MLGKRPDTYNLMGGTMSLPNNYVLPTAKMNSLVMRDVENRVLQANIMSMLTELGVVAMVRDDLIIVPNVGGVQGNKSVTIVLDLVEFDGKGTLLLQAFLGEERRGAEMQALAFAGLLTSQAMFGGVQVREPDYGPKQIWLVVPLMQADLSGQVLMDAMTLLADEADNFDDLVERMFQ